MKTMKKGTTIVRIPNNKYKSYLESGYVYTSKSEWREKVRDINKKKVVEKE